VLDLAKWDAELYRDDVLTRASREAMWTPVKLPDGTTSWYGFGWFVDSIDGHRFVGHGGSVDGFQSTLFRFLDDSLSVIVLTNSDGARPNDIALPIVRAYFLEQEEAVLRDGLARDNDSLEVHRRLASLYLSHQSYVKALEVLEQIVRKRPTDRSALLAVGLVGAEAGIAPDRAESALTAFLALPPVSGRGPGSNYPLAHYRLALIYEQRGQFDRARTEVATALQLNPEFKLAQEADQRLRRRIP
jgi:tetratricopeptide (TPR) repeat protein